MLNEIMRTSESRSHRIPLWKTIRNLTDGLSTYYETPPVRVSLGNFSLVH